MDYSGSDPASQSLVAAFRAELAKLGWKEGGNLRIELRWSAGSADMVRTFAKELVDLRPDAILGRGTPETIALARETRTIPIVFAAVSDPIGSGFAASLTHPGGNITGFANVESSVGGKSVELLKEIAPRTTHVALLFNPTTAPPVQFYMPSIQAAAASLAIQVSTAPIHATDGIESVIASLARDPGGGLIMMPDTFNLTNRGLIAALAARYGVPVVSNNPILRNRAASSLMALILSNCSVRQQGISIAFSEVIGQPICQSKTRPNSSLSSTSRPLRRSVSTCRRRCSPAPTR
jgi:putative tryptophan/tyrosine transport system substrate-binding protein